MIKDLLALEGADLRRPDTFLRNNDQDKILGNLYRITTDLGHVKWVCFENYKETYRQTGLSSFVQSVEIAGGTYNPHLGQPRSNSSPEPAQRTFSVGLPFRPQPSRAWISPSTGGLGQQI